MQTFTIAAPPSDVELGIPRDPLEYYVTVPAHGINAETGLIVFIPGWGMNPAAEYSANKLMPYLANTHNCVVTSASYHGIGVKYLDRAGGISVRGEWFVAVHKTYNIPLVYDLRETFELLAKAGVRKLDDRLPLEFSSGHEYLSFGFLPALDHIAVLGAVLAAFPVNTRRLFAFGSSYGGYIASLLLKFLPNTFALAIDNSGFSKTSMHELNYLESGRFNRGGKSHNGIDFSVIPRPVWTTKNPDSPHYFRPAFAMIRDLTVKEHWAPSKTALYCFHAREDKIAPYEDKRRFCEIRSERAPTHLKTVTVDDIDGKMFKSIAHGFEASLRDLFAHVQASAAISSANDPRTDFDSESRIELPCGDRAYVLQFDREHTFQTDLIAT